MTTTIELGTAFLTAVRTHFGSLFRDFRLHEVDARVDLNGAVLTAKGWDQYLLITCDFRDHWVEAAVGRLTEDVVSPPPIAPPRRPEDVRQVGSAILAWLSTGEKDRSFSAGTYDDETPQAVDSAVRDVAGRLANFGRRLLAGDQKEWERAAELTVTRQWRR